MKYRDSEGNLQEIYLPPTGDTLPIGSVIEYAGDTVPTNWELVEDTGTYKKIKKVANSVGLVANVTNEYSESTQDSYSCDYVNNAINEVNNKSYITASLTDNVFVGDTPIVLNKIIGQNANSIFTLENDGRIKINKDCVIKVSGTVRFGFSDPATKNMFIYKNNDIIVQPSHQNSTAITLSSNPIFINANNGDYIYLVGTSNIECAIVRTGTILTIEEV